MTKTKTAASGGKLHFFKVIRSYNIIVDFPSPIKDSNNKNGFIFDQIERLKGQATACPEFIIYDYKSL